MIKNMKSFVQKLCIRKSTPLVEVVRLYGAIGPKGSYGKSALSLETTQEALCKAFKNKHANAVALLINSPGGSPAQSDLISRKIQALALRYNKAVYAFVEDVAASGGYWIACSAREVYALETSMVGSIGVISAGFGFEQLIQRHGIERRTYAMGDQKLRLDPFQAEKPEDVAWLQEVQEKMHELFKKQVLTYRSTKIDAQRESEIFSGDIWLGEEAHNLGLIDGVGDLTTVMQSLYGEKVQFHVSESKSGFLTKLLSAQLLNPLSSVRQANLWSHWKI